MTVLKCGVKNVYSCRKANPKDKLHFMEDNRYLS